MNMYTYTHITTVMIVHIIDSVLRSVWAGCGPRLHHPGWNAKPDIKTCYHIAISCQYTCVYIYIYIYMCACTYLYM